MISRYLISIRSLWTCVIDESQYILSGQFINNRKSARLSRSRNSPIGVLSGCGICRGESISIDSLSQSVILRGGFGWYALIMKLSERIVSVRFCDSVFESVFSY